MNHSDTAVASPRLAVGDFKVQARIYFKAWLVLLFITVLMVTVANPALLIAGIGVKATIIALWFMHLKYERLDFALYVLVRLFGCALVLWGLIAPDGMAA